MNPNDLNEQDREGVADVMQIADNLREMALIEENARLRERVAELEAAARWIPCAVRLPKQAGEVVVTFLDLYDEWAFDVADYDPTSRLFYLRACDMHFDEKQIYGWKPLVEPAREGV
jgi:hypothetical protein